MTQERLYTVIYEDLSCYAMEQIDQIKPTKVIQLTKECRGEIPKLRQAGFLSPALLCLTNNGRNHLINAITCVRDENSSALRYTQMTGGFTVTFLALLVGWFQGQKIYSLFFAYLISLLFVSILMSVIAGYCFWHGCSREHGWKELRILNEMGDSWITFSGWILLYCVYLTIFLSLSQCNFPIEIPFLKETLLPRIPNYILLYFLVQNVVMNIWTAFTWKAYRRNEVKPTTVRNVIYDFINTSTFIASGGKSFLKAKPQGPPFGYILLILISIMYFAFPIILLTILV